MIRKQPISPTAKANDSLVGKPNTSQRQAPMASAGGVAHDQVDQSSDHHRSNVLVLEEVFTAKEAARFLKVSTSFLAKERMRGTGPVYVTVGRRAIRYTRSGLVNYVLKRQQCSTSAAREVSNV